MTLPANLCVVLVIFDRARVLCYYVWSTCSAAAVLMIYKLIQNMRLSTYYVRVVWNVFECACGWWSCFVDFTTNELN